MFVRIKGRMELIIVFILISSDWMEYFIFCWDGGIIFDIRDLNGWK